MACRAEQRLLEVLSEFRRGEGGLALVSQCPEQLLEHLQREG